MKTQDLIREYQTLKDYESMFTMMDSHDRLSWLIENYTTLYNDCGEEKYYELVRESLVLSDNHQPYRIYYPNIINMGVNHHHMMTPEEKKVFDDLPETLVIYRGVSSTTRLTTKNLYKVLGNSWTINYDVSVWFSHNHSQKYTGNPRLYVLEYHIPKSEVWSYFNTRNEDEIFLDVKKIDTNRLILEELNPLMSMVG